MTWKGMRGGGFVAEREVEITSTKCATDYNFVKTKQQSNGETDLIQTDYGGVIFGAEGFQALTQREQRGRSRPPLTVVVVDAE